MATDSCDAAEHVHVKAPSGSQLPGRSRKCVSRADAFAITISPTYEWFARPVSLPIRSHLVWHLPSDVPSIAAAGKTVATSNKKHFQRRQRQHLGTMGLQLIQVQLVFFRSISCQDSHRNGASKAPVSPHEHTCCQRELWKRSQSQKAKLC